MRKQRISGAEENIALQAEDMDLVALLFENALILVRTLHFASVLGPRKLVLDDGDSAVIECEQHAGDDQPDPDALQEASCRYDHQDHHDEEIVEPGEPLPSFVDPFDQKAQPQIDEERP